MNGFLTLWRRISAYRLAQFCFLAFVFCVPFQIQTFVLQHNSYDTGLFNPFVSFFITFSDLLLILSAVFWGFSVFKGRTSLAILTNKQRKLTFYILLFLASFEISVFFAANAEVAIFYIFRFLEFFLFYLLFTFRIVSFYDLKRVFLFSVLFQSFMGLFQYLEQSNLFFGFLGEPHITPETLDVAKLVYVDHALIRPYGTFVHPNLLAAFLLVAIFLSIFSWKREPVFYTAILSVFILVFILTFSRSAWLSLLVAFLFYFSATNRRFSVLYILLGLSVVILFIVSMDLFPVLVDTIFLRTGIIERFDLIDSARSIFYENPLGVGLGNFTLVMQDYLANKVAPWDLQPVHNVFFLILVEGGVIAFVAFLTLYLQIFRFVYRLYRKFKRRLLAGILLSIWAGFFVLSLFDHYLISLYQGQFLFWFFLALVSHYLELETTPLESEYL